MIGNGPGVNLRRRFDRRHRTNLEAVDRPPSDLVEIGFCLRCVDLRCLDTAEALGRRNGHLTSGSDA
ncbi:MAG: hypothetical protein QOI95_2913 [Acidimicrobiaceae bacterium]|jgi:hypothetical protein